MGRLKDAIEAIGNQPMQEQALLQQGLSREPKVMATKVGRTMIHTGLKDGVDVQADIENARYIVTTPNNYDVYWELARKDQNKIPFAERLPSEDRSVAVFAIPLDKISSEQGMKDFKLKIDNSRKTSVAIEKEREDLTYIVNFDHANGKESVFVYKDPGAGFVVAEVLKTGKYFVALTAGENEDKKYFRVMNTSRLLEGKEFGDRENAIADKLPVGSKKYMKFGEHGRVHVQDYTAKAAPVEKLVDKPVETVKPVEVAKVAEEAPGQMTRAQREAVMAVRESNPKAWKRELAAMWETGNYKGMDTNQAALLQQVRNTQGPEWLVKVTSKELYGITDEPVKAAKVKTMQMEM